MNLKRHYLARYVDDSTSKRGRNLIFYKIHKLSINFEMKRHVSRLVNSITCNYFTIYIVTSFPICLVKMSLSISISITILFQSQTFAKAFLFLHAPNLFYIPTKIWPII